jgi:hypothetical protein
MGFLKPKVEVDPNLVRERKLAEEARIGSLQEELDAETRTRLRRYGLRRQVSAGTVPSIPSPTAGT